MKIVMLCAPAKSGKDTLFPILQRGLKKQFGGEWKQYAFADKLKRDLEKRIKLDYDVSVWNDKKKHLFRHELIKYGEQRRIETDNRYLIDDFLRDYSPFVNYIITDLRFINEIHDLEKHFGKKNILPIYIERVFTIGGLEFITQPSIPQEIANYPEIKKECITYQIPWERGLFWKKKLNKYQFIYK